MIASGGFPTKCEPQARTISCVEVTVAVGSICRPCHPVAVDGFAYVGSPILVIEKCNADEDFNQLFEAVIKYKFGGTVGTEGGEVPFYPSDVTRDVQYYVTSKKLKRGLSAEEYEDCAWQSDTRQRRVFFCTAWRVSGARPLDL